MPPYLASIVCVVFIAGLFWLDREAKDKSSSALWIAVVWFSLAASRSVSQWSATTPSGNSIDLQLEGDPLDRAVYACLLAAGLIVLIRRANSVAAFLKGNWPIVVFLAYAAVSLLWSEFLDVAFKRWLKTVGDVVMVLIVWTDNNPTTALRRLFTRVSFLLMPLSIVLIKYYPQLGRTYGRWFGEVHYTGVTTNKNSLGAICLLFGLATVWRLFAIYRDHNQTGRTRKLIANSISMGIIVWLLWMAESMTSSACFVMGMSLLLALNLSSMTRNRRTVHLVIAATLVVCVGVLFFGVSPDALNAMGKSSTLTDRTEMWPLLVRLNKNSLLGTGFGSFWLGQRLAHIWRVYDWKPNQAHNGYLEIYLNLGWTGVVLLAVVIVTGYRNAFRTWRGNAAVGDLLLTYVVVGIAYNFTEASLFQMLAPVWIVLLLAMVGHSASACQTRSLTVDPVIHKSELRREMATDPAEVAV